MKAVVMAGGEGTRLRPLTSNQPKPMVPIVGKPCMEHILELLARARLRGRDRHARVPAAGDPQLLRRRRGARRATSSTRSRSRRSARPARCGSRADKLDDTFLVISGDALCDIDLTRSSSSTASKGAAVTIGAQVGREPARVRDRRHRRGRPGRALPREAVVGPGVLGHDQHRHLRARAGGARAHPGRPAVRLLQGALPAAARDGAADVRAACCDGYWQDIGNLDQFRQANFDALDERVAARRSPGIRLRGNIWMGEGVEIDDLEDVEGPAYHRQLLPHLARRAVGPYSVLSASVTLRERARTVRS